MLDLLSKIIKANGLVFAFVVVALITLLADRIATAIKQKRMSSSIAIMIGLLLAYIGGVLTNGKRGIADIELFSGMALLGGSMLRDYAIISTAYGAKWENLKKAGFAGTVSLFVGVFFSFFVGCVVALLLGYKDAVSVTTIGGGACTFIVGPVTGTALKASSEVIALSIAAGVVKSILTMALTPFVAPKIGLNNPAAAMVYGGIMGTTSGVAGGLAATDPKLVPYGAMTATFYTGLGCLLIPSVGFLIVKAILG